MTALAPLDDAAPSRHTRHSRFVQWMRRLLPVVALVLLAVLFAWPQMKADDDRVQVGYSSQDLKSLGRNALKLLNARYYGLSKDLKPFAVQAETARQDDPETIVLERPRADMLTEDGAGVLLDARQGLYHQKRQSLQLDGSVSLYHERGYEIHTDAVTVDLVAGVARSDAPVSGHGPQIQLNGEGFQMSGRGQTIHLTGKSQVVLYPGPRKEDGR